MSKFYVTHVRPLGEGGLATVDVVQVSSDGGPYPRGAQLARKQLGPQWANDQGAQGRFDREIQILSSMTHPGTVQVMGVSIPGVPRFYLMPLYPRSLRQLIADHGGRVPRAWAVQLGLKVAGALQYAHDMNFIHRDLKPENILMDDQNEPVVADWGLGQFIHQHSKVLDLKTQGGLGTPYYCPMEQWSTGRCAASGDVYALGLILAELTAGQRLAINPPFSGIRQDVVANDSPQAQFFNATIKKMTSLAAARRHASMNEVILDLLSCG